MDRKKTLLFFIVLITPLFLTAVFVVITDPFFHYHAPLKGYTYELSKERYQNDGIVRNFEYEALITGSSTTQNFLASDVKRLWGYECVKTPFAGGTLFETGRLVETAIKHNEDLKLVIRGADINMINREADSLDYDNIPYFMYDKNPFNDYGYLFNIDVLEQAGRSLVRSVKKMGPTSFDEYSNWNDIKVFGKEAVLATYERLPVMEGETVKLTEEDKSRIKDNLESNVIKQAEINPGIDFYIFVPPASVCFWDGLVRTDSLDKTIEILSLGFDILLEKENIRVFAFDDCTDITCDLDNYMDTLHYSEDINTFILESMNEGTHEITKENKEEYLDKIKNIYSTYDYDSIFD